MNQSVQEGLFAVGAYLLGSIPSALWLAKTRRWGMDLRTLGSGNIGTSNLYRHGGITLAVVAGPLQFLQGLLPILLARWAGLPLSGLLIVALAGVIGNGWPFYLGFNGGRGVAVATGAVLGLTWLGFLGLLICFLAGELRGQFALGVLLGFMLLPALSWVFAGPLLALGGLAFLLLILLRRLEGVFLDVRTFGQWRQIFWRRLIFDARPGRPLMGHRTDLGRKPTKTVKVG